MAQRSWAAFATRVAERVMGSLADIFGAAKKFHAEII